MKLVMTIDVDPADDVIDDADALTEFAKAIQDTFENRYSADPTNTHETEDGEFSFEITHNEVTVSYGTD